jgi:neutral amino acid transport system permease protein
VNELLQLLFNGVVTGSILAIGAAGASLVWGVLQIGNFAHGDYMALGAFIAYVVNVWLGLPLLVGGLVAMVVVAAFAISADRVILRRMRGRGLTSVFIITVGIGFLLRNGIALYFGPSARQYAIDQAEVYVIGPIRVSPGQAIAIVATSLAIGGVGWLLATTAIGRSMRAVSENRDLAAVTGVDIGRIETQTWLLSGALAGLAGMTLALVQGTFDSSLGVGVLFIIFTAVVLGGIGSAYGALAGGMVIGMVMEVSTWSAFLGGLDSRYKVVLAFGVLITLLLLRPQGLLGKARLL